MAGKKSRNKGAAGEREFFNSLSDWLGVDFLRYWLGISKIERNLQQTRSGGADNHEAFPFGVEVKRQEKLQITKWWVQTEEQAGDRTPVLAYRQNRGEWRILVGMDLPQFAEYVREQIPIIQGRSGVEKAEQDAGQVGGAEAI